MFLAFQFNHNLGERFFYTKSTSSKTYVELFVEKEPRVIIWSCALDQIKENNALLMGVGFKNTINNLVACYETSVTPDKRKNYFVERRFNTHNQFLDFFISKGIIPFLLFALLFITLIIKYRSQYAPLAFTIILFAFCNIENVFHRQFGAYFFAIVLFLILSYKTDTQKVIEQ
ncbi:hypothetical protein SCB49_06147 [unidentified eubacterium SCB49]|nr:hypothetical protein SCB49_06147 [unidentified eubacterium SCB49]